MRRGEACLAHIPVSHSFYKTGWKTRPPFTANLVYFVPFVVSPSQFLIPHSSFLIPNWRPWAPPPPSVLSAPSVVNPSKFRNLPTSVLIRVIRGSFLGSWLAIGKIIVVGSFLAGSPSLIGQTTSQNGFLGSYFNKPDFSQRVLVRVDSEVDFNWQTQSPGQGVNRDGFSVIWQGALTPEFSEEYTFLINSDGLVNLWIDDVLLVDGSRSPTSRTHSGKILLSRGQSYLLKLDYVHDTGDAFARLFWTSSSRSLEIIPKQRVTLSSVDINFPPMVQVPPSAKRQPPIHGASACRKCGRR